MPDAPSTTLLDDIEFVRRFRAMALTMCGFQGEAETNPDIAGAEYTVRLKLAAALRLADLAKAGAESKAKEAANA